LLDENIQHDTFDEYWKARDISEHFHKIHCAVLLFPFFDRYLKDAPAPDLPGALAFETGTNQWRRYEPWPPASAQPASLFLRANGKLAFDPPSEHEGAYDEYVSDPARPVPYVEHPSTGLSSEYMYGDQRFAAGRSDVLTYRTDPLDRDVTVAGPVTVRLEVSSSGTDSDFDVKLIDDYTGNDEYPAGAPSPGYQQLVRGEPMRARFRNSFSNPEALQPDQVTPIHFSMPDMNHTFLRGHRIMVQVQSSWFPLTDLNPQIFVSISKAKPADFVKATERVFHSPQAASALVLQVLQNPPRQ
jgi:putative CocE/NonD family hydrolase